ncbi:hypothetical protein V8E36_003462 [Tilletia maclaganii]
MLQPQIAAGPSRTFIISAKNKAADPSRPSTTRRTSSSSSDSSTLSAVAKGTAFEHATLALLRTHFNMTHLERIGGAGDRGIDLTGWWYYPSTSSSSSTGAEKRVRVLVQCKYQGLPLGPVYVRELEGVCYRKGFEARMLLGDDVQSTPPRAAAADDDESPATSPTQFYNVPLLGILASSSGFSSACARYALASPFPLLLLHLIDPPQNNHVGEQSSTAPRFAALPNPAFVAPTGLMRGRLEFRSTRVLSPRSPSARSPADEQSLDKDGKGSLDAAPAGGGGNGPASTIDSPEILLDGRSLVGVAKTQRHD